MTEPLFLAANKYQIDGLVDLCLRSLISKLNLETVVRYLVLAHLYTAPQLLEASLQILEHKKGMLNRVEWKQLNEN